MDETVASSLFAEQDTLGILIEHLNISAGNTSLAPEEKTQHPVLPPSYTTTE